MSFAYSSDQLERERERGGGKEQRGGRETRRGEGEGVKGRRG